MKCKWLEVNLLQKEHNADMVDMWCFDVDEKPTNEFELCYCVRYRPLELSEWILDRWWWNDKWYWTEDWIFNDWII